MKDGFSLYDEVGSNNFPRWYFATDGYLWQPGVMLLRL